MALTGTHALGDPNKLADDNLRDDTINANTAAIAGIPTATDVKIAAQHTADNGTYAPIGSGSGSTMALDLGAQPGVDPTGVVECSGSIQATFDSATAAGIRVFAKGTYKIASTITLACNADLSDATFNYTGTSGTAVRVGTATSGSFVEGLRVLLPKLYATAKTTTGWAQVAGTIGVDLSNTYDCYIEVPMVRNFETGMRNYGKGQGNCHNTVLIGHLNNNKVNQLVTADATGWSNQNLYLGGQLDHDSAEGSSVSGCRHLEIAVTTQTVNNNLWLNTSFEGDTPEFQAIVAGYVNVIQGGRWEVTGGARVKWASDSVGCAIRGGAYADTIVETFASGASGANDLDAVHHSWRTGSAGTGPVVMFENQSGAAYPTIMIMEAGARKLKYDPVTAYSVYVGADHMGMKRSEDTYDRIKIDHVYGRIYMGNGASAPVSYYDASGYHAS